MTCFQNLRNTLEDVFTTTIQSEDELNYASATLIVAGLLQMHARTPRYASHRARLESFPDSKPLAISSSEFTSTCDSSCRPHSPHPSPNELASAGFFYTGSADETVCPACGLGLRDWQPADQPETCHLAYSTAEVGLRSNDGSGSLPSPALPCLYLAVHRLLSSEIPLARKSLVPSGCSQSVGSLPGIVTPPISVISGDLRDNNCTRFVSLSDRLHAIAGIMKSPPSPQGWPVENARALGHSDDLIVLALWRLQAESTRMGLSCPTQDALRLDPQGTVELLRAILRLQEGFDAAMNEFLVFDSGSWDGFLDDGLSQPGDSADLTAEDEEAAALSRCANQRIRCVASANNSETTASTERTSLRRVRLPPLYQFIRWWSNRWPDHSHAQK